VCSSESNSNQSEVKVPGLGSNSRRTTQALLAFRNSIS
jgi:hypothetical protein